MRMLVDPKMLTTPKTLLTMLILCSFLVTPSEGLKCYECNPCPREFHPTVVEMVECDGKCAAVGLIDDWEVQIKARLCTKNAAQTCADSSLVLGPPHLMRQGQKFCVVCEKDFCNGPPFVPSFCAYSYYRPSDWVALVPLIIILTMILVFGLMAVRAMFCYFFSNYCRRYHYSYDMI